MVCRERPTFAKWWQVITYRQFRNSDPPAIAEIWRNQPPQRGLAQPLTTIELDRSILSKPYFDARGLRLAFEGGRPLGFVHAAFGPSADGASIDCAQGLISMLMVVPHAHSGAVERELLDAAEDYLRQRGAKTVTSGGNDENPPFYLGIYGGAEYSGVLMSDDAAIRRYLAAGYVETNRRLVMQKRLNGFRAPVDRKQMALRRKYTVTLVQDPAPATWWDACVHQPTDRQRFSARDETGEVRGTVDLWSISTMASNWGVNAVGISELKILETTRRQGLGTFLVAEALKSAVSEGAALAETHIPLDNAAALKVCKVLGFEEVDVSITLRKKL
jgi:GNAT superfamily N-acetyltransferase